eukprot:2731820-Rhodomonas_salina.1
MSGTDLRIYATRCPVLTYGPLLLPGVGSSWEGSPLAAFGTPRGGGGGWGGRSVSPVGVSSIRLCWDAKSGTERGYAGARQHSASQLQLHTPGPSPMRLRLHPEKSTPRNGIPRNSCTENWISGCMRMALKGAHQHTEASALHGEG